MDAQKFPTLVKALQDIRSEHTASNLPPELANLIDDETALASMIDGAIGGVLETLAMASVVANAQAMRKGGTGLDYSKIKLARLKLIEALLEMLEESKAEAIVDEQMYVGDGTIGVVSLLREFADFIRPTAEEQSE